MINGVRKQEYEYFDYQQLKYGKINRLPLKINKFIHDPKENVERNNKLCKRKSQLDYIYNNKICSRISMVYLGMFRWNNNNEKSLQHFGLREECQTQPNKVGISQIGPLVASSINLLMSFQDKNSDLGATDQFNQINEAYTTLSKEESKSKYDRKLQTRDNFNDLLNQMKQQPEEPNLQYDIRDDFISKEDREFIRNFSNKQETEQIKKKRIRKKK